MIPGLPVSAAEKPPAAPTLDHIHPVAVPAGAATNVTALGRFAPWPPQVWADSPGIAFRPAEKPGQFEIEVGAGVPPGPHLIRLYNERGASAPRILVVTAEPDATETEPNDAFAQAPRIERLPVTIGGRLNKSGDVDSFAVALESGQTLIASVDAYVLGSPVDPVLRLVDSRGLELALNHDNGRNLDPALAWTAPAAGTYILQLFGFAHPATSDVRFTGSDLCVYRLHLSRGPQIRYTLPLGASRSRPTQLRVHGWNLPGIGQPVFDVRGSTFPASATRGDWRRPEFENGGALPIGDGPEWLESEMGARDDGSPPPRAPFAVTACIERIGERDRFAFTAARDEKVVLAVESASLGFALDAWLAIQDASGKELVRNDDAANADPVLEWTAPADGTFFAVVGSVLQRAGQDHLYRLSIQPPHPRFQGVIAESGLTLSAGKTSTLKVTARRLQGFKSALTASIVGLPEGVTAGPVELGEADKELTLKLTASSDAPAFSGPVRVQLREANSDTFWPALHELTSTTLRNGVPQGFRDLLITSTPDIWLTVLAAPATVAGN